jgi:ferredoxin-NADP reductase
MKIHDIRLERREPVAEGTMAFHFRKPEGFAFKPGQAVDLILADPDHPEQEAPRHAFSIVSAPWQDELVIATRMRDSSYKQRLKALPDGSAAQLEGPFGSLTLHRDSKRPAVFLAGGIGITPFMSMLRQAAKDLPPRDLVLLYSNRRPEDAAFLDELRQLEKANARFRLVATMTDMPKSFRPWDGRTGVIDGALISSLFTADVAPVYYLAGPPGMVEALKESLNGLGIDDDDIRSEEFYGY